MPDTRQHNCLFTTRSFELFEELYDGTDDFALSYTEFKEFVEQPFQQLCTQIATQLPNLIAEKLENKEGAYNGLICWDNEEINTQEQFYLDYAFYFKNQESDGDAQLFVQINEKSLKFGFYVAENRIGIDNRIRFLNNLQAHQKDIEFIILDILGKNNTFHSRFSNSENDESELTWKNWLEGCMTPEIPEIYAAVHLTVNEVLQCSMRNLSNQIVKSFERFFPLVLLASSDNPMPAIRQYLNLPTQEYTLEQFEENTGIEKAKIKRWLNSIARKKQAILYGSPGTGKTYIAEQLANYLISRSDGFLELVQFHPAYSYEDFIQGIRPQSQDGVLTYPLIPGCFLEFCKRAKSRKGLCVLIIDEINRANLAQVFGELMYLLEYRNKKIRLAGSREPFSIPENVRIIGTMNTADRSIALVDHALRRRFAFIELRPNYDALRRYHEKKKTGFQLDGLIKTLERLNNAIANKHYEIGISFFLTENLAEDIEDIWQMEIEPYLEEYFFDQLDKVDQFRWDKIKKQVCP